MELDIVFRRHKAEAFGADLLGGAQHANLGYGDCLLRTLVLLRWPANRPLINTAMK